MDLGGWLRSLDLEEYEAAFHKNHIDEVVLPNLTTEDLRDLGVGSIGHRRKLLDAIALLRGDAKAKAPPPKTPSVPKSSQDTAERRQVTVMFCDLVGSTALSGRMDPEDLREIISAYQTVWPRQSSASAGSLRSTWATACSCTLGIHRPMRTTPNGRCELVWS
jgi:class 3 adenylate cyclase